MTKRSASFTYAFFALIGAGLLIGASFIFQSTRSFAARADRAIGKIVGFTESRGSKGTIYSYAKVRFPVTKGRTVEFVDRQGSNPPAYGIGDTVSILYAPDRPENARIDSFSGMWFVPLLLSAFGLVFFLVGSLPLLFDLRRKRIADSLKQNGQTISATTFRVEKAGYSVNGRTPFQIVAEWQNPTDQKLYTFRSSGIWFDPTPYLKMQAVQVRIDPNNPKRYDIDTSFLPEQA